MIIESKDIEMKIDKCALLLDAEEATLTALYRKTHRLLCCYWIRNCFRKPHLYNSSLHCHFKQTGAGSLQIYLEQSSFSQTETRFQLKPVQNHTAMFHLCYSAIELQWTSMSRT